MQKNAVRSIGLTAVLRTALLVAGVLALGGSPAFAQGYTFTQLDVPRSTMTEPRAINDNGEVVGEATNAKAVTTGFLYNSMGHFVTFSPKGSTYTQAVGINANDHIVGMFRDGANVWHGYLYIKGKFTSLDPAGSTGTFVWGINNNDEAVGSFTDAAVEHGFTYMPPASFTTLDATPVTATSFTGAFGVNSFGDVAGLYSNGTIHGFVYIGGSYTTIDPPGSVQTHALSINASGQVTGFYYDTLGNAHGFLYDPGTATYTSLDPSGSTFAVATGINDAGQAVGYFTDGSGYHGYVYSAGTYTTLDPPGSTGAFTLAEGINNAGQVVGVFQDAASVMHGFLAKP
jgi:probable HAF family extracellular repeat protein